MMKETNIQSQVTSTIAGDDGEAVGKSEANAKKMASKKPNEGLEKTDDAGWFVAVVRVNCEADAGQTNKWLAEQLGKDPVTVSKWCMNTTQPDLQTLARISELLKVNIRELLVNQNF